MTGSVTECASARNADEDPLPHAAKPPAADGNPSGNEAEAAPDADAKDDEPQPDDEQLVTQLTSGELEMTDQVSVCAQLGFRTTARDHGHVGGLLAGKIGANKFVADYAVDSRAKCRDTKCNAYILQSDLRIGKIPPSIKTGHSCRTHWYHLPCIFRSFRRACKGTKIINGVADVTNFDRLRREDQERIRLCIQSAKNARDQTSRTALHEAGTHVITDSSSPASSIDSSPAAEAAGSSKRKAGASAPLRPIKKERVDMGGIGGSVSAHEVESILGLTMLSRDKSSPNGSPRIPTTRPPAVAPPPIALLDEHPPRVDGGASSYVKLASFAQPQISDDDSTRWRSPGSTCEVLYHDKWHAAVVERYTDANAVIRIVDDEQREVRIDLVGEKHRVCWTVGAMTSRSSFA